MGGQQLFKFLTLFRGEFRANVVPNLLQLLLEFRADEAPQDSDAFVALGKNPVDAVGLIGRERKLFLEPGLKALLGENLRDKRLGQWRLGINYFSQNAPGEHARGENDDRGQDDFPDFHQTSSPE